MLNLDTHILIDFARGALSKKELEVILEFEGKLQISDIVLWEIAKLSSKGRIEFDLNSKKMKMFLKHFLVQPISPEIAELSTKLDFSSDPADEIITATAILSHGSLITRDKKIRKTKLVKIYP